MLKRKIYAVHDRDLIDFLKNLNLYEKVLQGEIYCTECGCLITLENIGYITLAEGKGKIACDNLDCCYHLVSKHRGGRGNES